MPAEALSPERRWDNERHFWPNRDASRFVTAGGIRWHLYQAGRGPTMLLVHGTGSSAHTWRDLLAAFAADHTVIAPDLPGHGYTASVNEQRYSLDGMSTALAALLGTLGLAPGYAIGHSAGAAIVSQMVLAGHIEPRRIVSINGAFLPFAGAASAIFSPLARMLAASTTLAGLIARRARDRAVIERMIAGTGSRLDREGVDLYARLVQDPRHVTAALEMMGRWSLGSFERDLSRLRVPLTLLVGDRDLAVPPSQARRLQSRLPCADLVVMPDLGHLAHEEAPQRVIDCLRTSLAGG